MSKTIDDVLRWDGEVALPVSETEVPNSEVVEPVLSEEEQRLADEQADAAEVIAHGLPEELVGSLRQALGVDANEVIVVLRQSLASANEKVALDAAKLVLDALQKLPRKRIVGTIPRTPAEVEELSWAETQAAMYVLVSGKAQRLAEQHGEEEAARILWEDLSPVTRAVVVRAAA